MTARPVTLDIRDPATAADPVALVGRHLDAGAAVTVWDSAGTVPTFALARRGSGIAVLNEDGAPLAAYADVRAALHHGLTRWPAPLVASLERAVDAAIEVLTQSPKFRRSVEKSTARHRRSARYGA